MENSRNKKDNQKPIMGIPLKPIKRILKRYYGGEISEDTCNEVRNLLNKIAHVVAVSIIGEFEKNNSLRVCQGLPKLKRLNIAAIIKRQCQIFKLLDDIAIGEVGQCNSETTFQKQER